MTNPILVDTPVMTIEKFAEKVGVTPASVRSMINTRCLATIKKGKRRFINIVALTHECLQLAESHQTDDDE